MAGFSEYKKRQRRSAAFFVCAGMVLPPQKGYGHVVDVGAGGAGHDETAHLLESMVGVVVLEHAVDDHALSKQLCAGLPVTVAARRIVKEWEKQLKAAKL